MPIRKIIPWLLVCLLFAGIYIVYTWPLAENFTTQIPGRLDKQSDVPVFYNNIYLFEKKIHAGENPLQNDMEMHPVGFNMAMNSHNFSMGLWCLLFENNILGLNIGLLLSFILSGLGAGLLCFRFVPNYRAAVLAGIIFAFSPWKMIKLQDHLWYALTAAIPFYVYHFIDIFDFEKNRRWPVIKNYKKVLYCFLLGVLTALSEYYLTFFLLYFSIFYILIKKYIRPWRFNFKKIKTWLVIIAIVLGGGTLVSLLSQWGLDDKGAIYWGGDLFAYFYPVYKGYMQEILLDMGVHIPTHVENYFYLGVSLPLFFLLLILYRRQLKNNSPEEIKSFGWLALVFMLMTLPALKILGHFFIYMPTAVIHYIPFINNVRVITRIFLMFSLFFPIFVLWYYYSIDLKNRKLVTLLVIILLLVDFYPGKYDVIDSTQTPQAVYEVQKMKGEVVLPIPAGIRDGFIQKGLNNSDMLYYQTVFDKKMIGGYTARLSESVQQVYLSDSVMKDIFVLSENPDTIMAKRGEVYAKEFFNYFNPGIICIHPDYKTHGVLEYISYLAQQGGLTMVYDKDYIIYARK